MKTDLTILSSQGWFAFLSFSVFALCSCDSFFPSSGRSDYVDTHVEQPELPAAEVYHIQPVEDTTYVYDFYPECQVYYNHDLHRYTYLRNGKWECNERLPEDFRDRIGHNCTKINISGDHPERFHQLIQHDFPRDWHQNESRAPHNDKIYGRGSGDIERKDKSGEGDHEAVEKQSDRGGQDNGRSQSNEIDSGRNGEGRSGQEGRSSGWGGGGHGGDGGDGGGHGGDGGGHGGDGGGGGHGGGGGGPGGGGR